MRLICFAILALVATGCSRHHPRSPDEGGRAPHAHGGGQHGNPADLERYIAAQESPERAEWQKPDAVVEKLALPPGATACEIGPGPGYFTLRLAKAVGEKGLVYAADVEPRMLGVLRDRLEKAGTRNVVPILGLSRNPLIPAGSCDVVLLVNTLHHLEDPASYLAHLKTTLKPTGRIANIDFHKRPTPMGPPVAARIDRADFLAMADKAGFGVAAEHDLLPHQYFVELRAK